MSQVKPSSSSLKEKLTKNVHPFGINFFRAAITKNHKLGDNISLFCRFRVQKSKIQVLAELISSVSSEGECVPCLYHSFWGLPAVLEAPCLVYTSFQPLHVAPS